MKQKVERSVLAKTFASLALGTLLEWCPMIDGGGGRRRAGLRVDAHKYHQALAPSFSQQHTKQLSHHAPTHRFDFAVFASLDHTLMKIFNIEGPIYWTIFAIGFIARPVGAIIFGWIGDTTGRRLALLISIVGIALPTVLIGCLPTYSQIGIAAPILLAIFRFVQGIALGGEYGSALIYIQEIAPDGWEAVFGNSMATFSNIAVILGNVVVIILESLLNDYQMALYGWRLPFLVAALTGTVTLVLRRLMPESESFLKRKALLEHEADMEAAAEQHHAHYSAVELGAANGGNGNGARASSPSSVGSPGSGVPTPRRQSLTSMTGGAPSMRVMRRISASSAQPAATAATGSVVSSAAPSAAASAGAGLPPMHHTRVPLFDLIAGHGVTLLLHILYLAGTSSFFYIGTTWLPSYLRSQGIAANVSSAVLCTSLVPMMLICIAVGWLLDRGLMALRTAFIVGAIGIGLGFATAHVVTSTHAALGPSWGMSVLLLAVGGWLNGFYPTVLMALYPDEVRLSGVNLGYNLAYGCIGGCSSLVVVLIKERSAAGSLVNNFAPAWWLLACGGASLCSLAIMNFTRPWANFTRSQQRKRGVLSPWDAEVEAAEKEIPELMAAAAAEAEAPAMRRASLSGGGGGNGSATAAGAAAVVKA